MTKAEEIKMSGMELVKMNPECFDVSDAELKEAIWLKLDEQTGVLEDGTYRDEVRSPRNKMKVYHFELPCTDDFEFDVTSIEVKRVR